MIFSKEARLGEQNVCLKFGTSYSLPAQIIERWNIAKRCCRGGRSLINQTNTDYFGKGLFPVLFGNDLHYTLILEAVQAWPLVSNSGNSCHLELLLSGQHHQHLYSPARFGRPPTLCADFIHFPEGAKQYAEPFKTVWKQVSASGENVWECSRDRCNMSPAEEWGRCLQVDRVTENSAFNYTTVEVLPVREYSSAFTGSVHRSVLFNVQG